MAAEKAAAALAMSVGSQDLCADDVLPFGLDFGLDLLLSPGRRCPRRLWRRLRRILAALRTAPVGTTFVGELMRARLVRREARGQTRHVEASRCEHTHELECVFCTVD